MEAPRLIVLIPTYNEVDNIGLIIEQVFAVNPNFHVLIIDDNSPDGTAKVVALKSEMLPHLFLLLRTKNKGFAQSYLDGFRQVVSRREYDVIVTMDADFSHDPKEIPAMLDMICGGADVVVGSRYARAKSFRDIPLWRRWLSRLANTYVRLILRLPVRDCTSGFIAMRRPVLEKLNFTGVRTEGYGFLFELKYCAVRAGFSLREHAVDWPNRHLGASKMNIKRILESARLPWLIRFRR